MTLGMFLARAVAELHRLGLLVRTAQKQEVLQGLDHRWEMLFMSILLLMN